MVRKTNDKYTIAIRLFYKTAQVEFQDRIWFSNEGFKPGVRVSNERLGFK